LLQKWGSHVTLVKEGTREEWAPWVADSAEQALTRQPRFVFGLAYQDHDIVFRFIIEYSSLMHFCPSVIDFFIWGFFEDYTFTWWNIWVSIILLLP
jgi:hypothetical protein